MMREFVLFITPGRPVLYLLLMCLAAMTASVNAAESGQSSAAAAKQATNPQPRIDPQADTILKAMDAYLESLRAFSFHSEVSFDDVLPSEQKMQYSRSSGIVVRRPDRVYAETTGELGKKRFWYDGKQITLRDDDRGLYAQRAVPDSIDSTLDYLLDRLGFLPPVSDLIYSDPYAGMMKDVVYGFYVGPGSVQGVPVHHLAFVQKYIDWQIWIEAGAQPKPKKLVISYKSMPASPQFTAVFRDWKALEAVDDETFAAQVQGAIRIEFLPVAATAGMDTE